MWKSKFWLYFQIVKALWSSKMEKQPSRGVLSKRCSELYWNHTSAWVFSCEFAAYFQNTFYYSNFIEITLRYGCSPVNLVHIFRTLFTKNTSERLLLKMEHLNGTNHDAHSKSNELMNKISKMHSLTLSCIML